MDKNNQQKEINKVLGNICAGANILSVLIYHKDSFDHFIRMFNFVALSFLAWNFYLNNMKKSFLFSLFFVVLFNPFEKIKIAHQTLRLCNFIIAMFLINQTSRAQGFREKIASITKKMYQQKTLLFKFLLRAMLAAWGVIIIVFIYSQAFS